MHVVAIPTVEKKRYFTKRSKEYKELAEQVGEKNLNPTDNRLLKELERQVSHSKFFESQKDDSHRLVYSYSVWQDEILDSLKSAGFTDLHRGNSNQKAVHIHPSAYKNLMEKIKCDADGLLEDFKAEQIDKDKFLISKKSFDDLLVCKANIEKKMVAFDLAAESLQKEKSKVYDRQNTVYQKALEQMNIQKEAGEVERLEKEADRLREENKQLRSIFKFLNEKVSELVKCFKAIINKWMQFRSNELPDKNLIKEIDYQIGCGVAVLHNRKDAVIFSKLNMQQDTR